MDVPTYLTETEVAQILQVKANTLKQWRSRGQGPQFKKVGSLVRYRIEDIEAWVEAGSTPTEKR